MKTKVGVVSLGCDKNRVDSEVMLAKLAEGGYEIVASPQDADVIIVNTCAFLESARREAIETLFEMARYKTMGKCKKVIVTGCLGQLFGDDLLKELVEVDAIVGAFDYDKICDIVADTLKGKRQLYSAHDDAITFGKRILTTAPHVAYLKIADGCNNFCTYCLIPHIRGRFRSVKMEDILAQAQDLARQGVRELILVAQDTTMYGKDLYGELRLPQLLRSLSQIDGIEWIRILYAYPELVGDELIEEIASNDKVVNYVDIPLQHCNDDILKKMNRRSNSECIVKLFDKLAEKGIAVRSTFICGFPGETRKTVKELEDFLEKYKLRNVGFFPYSREHGTPAYKFGNQVSDILKRQYVKKLYQTQYKIAKSLNESDVGKTYKCIIDSDFHTKKKDAKVYSYTGRTYYMTPEIDGVVHITCKHPLEAGAFYNVKITAVNGYDLVGEVE